MSDFNVKLDTQTASDIAVQYLTYLLDNDHFPENKEIEFMLACQEVLHFIMIPQEWEERFGKDFVEYSENTLDVTEWWEQENKVREKNKKAIEKLKQYDEWRRDES